MATLNLRREYHILDQGPDKGDMDWQPDWSRLSPTVRQTPAFQLGVAEEDSEVSEEM